jgi:hypothetical protein
MIPFMFLFYSAWAAIIAFGVVAIFTAFIHRDGRYDWEPTKIGRVLLLVAMILFFLAGAWIAVQKLIDLWN